MLLFTYYMWVDLESQSTKSALGCCIYFDLRHVGQHEYKIHPQIHLCLSLPSKWFTTDKIIIHMRYALYEHVYAEWMQVK